MHFLLLTLRVWRAFVVARRGFLVGGKAYAVLKKACIFSHKLFQSSYASQSCTARRIADMDTRKSPLYAGFFVPEKRYRTLNALVVANTGLSACWLFRQEVLVCHVNQKR
ncbi:TPA: hypothetical protein ACOM2R_004973, partial [Escherichia coli]